MLDVHYGAARGSTPVVMQGPRLAEAAIPPPAKIAQLDHDLSTADWQDYRINSHALKSAALTIGCRSLNEKAKAQEQAAKVYLADDATPNQQKQAVTYLKQHHADIITLYQEAAELASGHT